MTDIVDRLQDALENTNDDTDIKLFRDAIDEIEKLRKFDERLTMLENDIKQQIQAIETNHRRIK